MKLGNIIFFLPLFLLSANLLGADQGQELYVVMDRFAQDQQDWAHLQGLVNQAGMIKQIRLQNLAKDHYAHQFFAEAICQFEASCGFEKSLHETIEKISHEDLKAELNDLELDLKRTHLNHNAHKLSWPLGQITLEIMRKNYESIYSAVGEKIERIAKSYQKKFLSDRDRKVACIEGLLKAGHIEKHTAAAVSEALVQQGLLQESIQALTQEKLQLESLVSAARAELGDLKKERDEAALQIAEQKRAVLQTAEETKQFQIELGKMVELSFLGLTKNKIEMEGIESSGPRYEKMKASLIALLEMLEREFDESHMGKNMKEEKIARHHFVLRVKSISMAKKKKWVMNAALTAEVAHQNIKESTRSHDLVGVKFYEDRGFDKVKNQDLWSAFREILFDEIPAVKNRVYAQAMRAENQQMLINMAASVLQKYPISGLSAKEPGDQQKPAVLGNKPKPRPCCPDADSFCLTCWNEVTREKI